MCHQGSSLQSLFIQTHQSEHSWYCYNNEKPHNLSGQNNNDAFLVVTVCVLHLSYLGALFYIMISNPAIREQGQPRREAQSDYEGFHLEKTPWPSVRIPTVQGTCHSYQVEEWEQAARWRAGKKTRALRNSPGTSHSCNAQAQSFYQERGLTLVLGVLRGGHLWELQCTLKGKIIYRKICNYKTES